MPGRRSSRRTAASVSTARCSPRSDTPRAAFRSRRASPGTGAAMSTSSSADPGAAKHYLFNGKAPKEGDVIRLPALAATLKTIAAKGARAFYEGEIADDMAATVGRARLVPDARRISRATAAMSSTPISTQLSRPRSASRLPPNGQGLTALVMLNILENFDLEVARSDRARALPSRARSGAARLMRVRDTHIADADHMRTPVADLLDKGFAQEARRADRPEQARQAAGRADAGQRHGLSHGRRPRPHGGVVHQFALTRTSAPASAPRRPASC